MLSRLMLSISMAMAVRCKMLLIRLLNLVRVDRWQAALWGRCKKIKKPLLTTEAGIAKVEPLSPPPEERPRMKRQETIQQGRCACVQDIMEAGVADAEPPTPTAVPSGADGKPGKGGLKAGAVKFGQFLYGNQMPTWGYMPTC